jgi:4-aminobutyrate aminotransferase / (S)-3-amino-2-methylpropionate transaminase / 5-aminovalerate transaminase
VTLRARLQSWQQRYPRIGDVRGLGPMLGIELVKDRATKEPDKAFTAALARYCYEHGLIVLTAGTLGNVVRLMMPLVIEDAELEEGLGVLERGFAELGA